MTTQTKKAIQGKVARVLNSREVALNVGSAQGVEVDMVFDILTPKGYEIKDPDTGEVLGSLERTKTRVRVVRVLDRISVATTFRRTEVNVGGDSARIRRYLYGENKAFEPPRWTTQYETLETTEAAWDELPDEDRRVFTGDPVVQVFHDDELDIF